MWRPVAAGRRPVTLLLGGWAALRQHDLKLLLAYGTVSQLGLLMALFGAGSRDAALAGAAMLLAHALFKAALFLVVGIVDRSAGTRDLRELSGLGRARAVAGGGRRIRGGVHGRAAAAARFRRQGGGVRGAAARRRRATALVLAGLVLGSALTVAYTAAVPVGGLRRQARRRRPHDRAGSGGRSAAAPALLAVAGLVVGVFAPAVDADAGPCTPTPCRPPTPAYHLALWHGFTPALGLSALALAAGAALFSARWAAPAGPATRLPFDGADASTTA